MGGRMPHWKFDTEKIDGKALARHEHDNIEQLQKIQRKYQWFSEVDRGQGN